jgi:hypothetical protein
VAGFGFRTIGRLGQTTQFNQAIYLNHPSQSSISVIHLSHPSQSCISINLSQSDRGGLRLQDNRQTGRTTHLKQPPQTINPLINLLQPFTPSLTVAGRLASGQSADWTNNPLQNNHLKQSILQSTPPINLSQSDRGGPFGFRTIGRLVEQPLRSTTSINPIQRSEQQLPV